MVTRESDLTDTFEGEVHYAARYIINQADPQDRDFITAYGRNIAQGIEDTKVNTNGIAALFRSGVIEMAKYRAMPEDVWIKTERAIALAVFNRMEE